MKLTSVLIGLAMAASMPASTIFFGGGGNLGSSHAYGPVTATGYTANNTPGTLFGKGAVNGTGSEDGLGLTGDPTGDNEIYANLATGAPASDFIQLSIAGLSGPISISMGSTGGDTWAVFGSHTAGTLGTTMLASGGGDDGAEVLVTNATSWEFLDVRAVTNNVLIQDLVYTSSVPEPGTLGIVGLGGVLIGLLRRKFNQN